MKPHDLHNQLHIGGWNFLKRAPLYEAPGCQTCPFVSVLRSLLAVCVPTETPRRFSSLPLFFVSGRFATFFFPTPALGGRP